MLKSEQKRCAEVSLLYVAGHFAARLDAEARIAFSNGFSL